METSSIDEYLLVMSECKSIDSPCQISLNESAGKEIPVLLINKFGFYKYQNYDICITAVRSKNSKEPSFFSNYDIEMYASAEIDDIQSLQGRALGVKNFLNNTSETRDINEPINEDNIFDILYLNVDNNRIIIIIKREDSLENMKKPQ